jgi:hypothetical protein
MKYVNFRITPEMAETLEKVKLKEQNNQTYKGIIEQSDTIIRQLNAKSIDEALLMLQKNEVKKS